MATAAPLQTFEVYMVLHDRELLAWLMKRQNISSRQLAKAAGWGSHSYVLRLLSGEAKTCAPEPAVRIAEYVGMPTSKLFTVRSSGNNGQVEQQRRSA